MHSKGLGRWITVSKQCVVGGIDFAKKKIQRHHKAPNLGSITRMFRICFQSSLMNVLRGGKGKKKAIVGCNV